MRFLADENLPRAVVAALVDAGHDVVWIGATAAGIEDAEIMALADREHRIVLTLDKDFGEADWAGRMSVVEPGRIRMRPLG